jgi:hypothetical protein
VRLEQEFVSASANRGGMHTTPRMLTSTSLGLGARASNSERLTQAVTSSSQGGARNETFFSETSLSISIGVATSEVPRRATSVT